MEEKNIEEKNEKNELNDIILNRNSEQAGNKKFMLAIAGLGATIIIIIIVLMNTISSEDDTNLPQAVLPPKPTPETVAPKQPQHEQLFEEVEVVQEDNENENLEKIAQKLKEETNKEEEIIDEVAPLTFEKPKPKPVVKKPTVIKHETKIVAKPQHKKPTIKVSDSGHFYIQIGSFSKYEPNKTFLKSVTKLGYKYRYHKVGKITKVVVGPFKTRTDANNAKKELRSKVEAGAFLIKI